MRTLPSGRRGGVEDVGQVGVACGLQHPRNRGIGQRSGPRRWASCPPTVQIQENEYTSFLVGLPDVRLSVAQADVAGGRLRRLRSHHCELIEYQRPVGNELDPERSTIGSGHIALEVDDIDATRERCERMGAVFLSHTLDIAAGSIAVGGWSTAAPPMASSSSSSSPRPCLARRRRPGSEHEDRRDHRSPSMAPWTTFEPIRMRRDDRQPRDHQDHRWARRRGDRAGW